MLTTTPKLVARKTIVFGYELPFTAEACEASAERSGVVFVTADLLEQLSDTCTYGGYVSADDDTAAALVGAGWATFNDDGYLVSTNVFSETTFNELCSHFHDETAAATASAE